MPAGAETKLLNSLFGKGNEVKLSSLATTFSSARDKIKKAIMKLLLEKELITKTRVEYFNNYHPAWYHGSGITAFSAGSFTSAMNSLSTNIPSNMGSSSGSRGGGRSGDGCGGGGLQSIIKSEVQLRVVRC